jgi:hypothetical protein
MEMSQGNQCISILSTQKCHFFFFTKTENKRAEQVPSGEGLVPVGEGRKKEVEHGANIMYM